MDKHTKAIYKRGALFVLPILAIVGCRVGLRACVALNHADRRAETDRAIEAQFEQQRQAEIAAAQATSDQKQRARARTLPSAAPGSVVAPIASAQQAPDSLTVDDQFIAWLSTHSGEVVVAPRGGGAPRVVAREQKLPQMRHVQGAALASGWIYWISRSLRDDGSEDGAILRTKVSADSATPPEVVASDLGGLIALSADKDGLYYARSLRVSRDDDDKPTGGVWRIRLDKKGQPVKDAQSPHQVLAAERPCGIATDDGAIYVVEQTQVWRAPKAKGDAKVIVKGIDRLGCSIAVDDTSVYWTVPFDDSLMRAKKTDGSALGVAAFVRKRPTNVVVDRGYAYVLAETSPQALGEMGGIFRVPLRSEQLTPQALVVDQVGLMSVAANKGFVAFAAWNEAESDGTIVSVANDPLGVDAGR